MPYFTSLDAPDAAALGTTTLVDQFGLRMVFEGRQQPASQESSRLFFGYLYVVDKAVREYTAGRAALLAHATGERASDLYEGIGRMENCINSAKRALRFHARLGASSSPLRIDRTLKRLVGSKNDILTNLRDAIEHIDGDIMSPAGLEAGEAHALMVDTSGSRLEIGRHSISFVELHAAVAALFDAGVAMILALPAPPPPADA